MESPELVIDTKGLSKTYNGVAALAVVHGPIAAYRLVVSTFDTQIDDYLRYPARQLDTSDSPFSFAVAEREMGIPASVLQTNSVLDMSDHNGFGWCSHSL